MEWKSWYTCEHKLQWQRSILFCNNFPALGRFCHFNFSFLLPEHFKIRSFPYFFFLSVDARHSNANSMKRWTFIETKKNAFLNVSSLVCFPNRTKHMVRSRQEKWKKKNYRKWTRREIFFPMKVWKNIHLHPNRRDCHTKIETFPSQFRCRIAYRSEWFRHNFFPRKILPKAGKRRRRIGIAFPSSGNHVLVAIFSEHFNSSNELTSDGIFFSQVRFRHPTL